MSSGHGVRVAIIGGSDAGIAAALRCRELAPDADVTVLVADAYPNYSICGLPFYIAGHVPDWRSLAHRSRDELERTGMTLLLEHLVTDVDVQAKRLHFRRTDGRPGGLDYDVGSQAWERARDGLALRPARRLSP
jgi:NADPH-dependent 2,4-dienoyl-CoA reductase/sulfur reductase-like enzyme